jgi:hypothetical protein|tara:strand:- start:29557 stop:30984 length:1428 start_codon:yes stop_codon:yes gene_type:complete
MAKVDISATTVHQGTNTFYTFHVIDKETGQVQDSISTTDKAKAEKFFDTKKKDLAGQGATLNGNSLDSADPFEDGSFVNQGDDVQVGGWASGKKYDSDGNEVKSTPTPYTAGQALADNPDVKISGQARKNKNPIGASKLRKLARDYCGLSGEESDVIRSLSPKETEEKIGGTFHEKRNQPQCIRLTLPSETTIGQGRDNNAFIVIGNDRAGPPTSGYGAKGHTQCDSIDLVAGLAGFCPKGKEKVEVEDVDGSKIVIEGDVHTNPNFFVDAARIYISQKTDVDKNFGIGEFGRSKSGNPPSQIDKEIGKYGAKSAVVAKADNIRLIGRESMRLVTGTDEFNSTGGRVMGKHGIELVAMNKTEDLQPMVLGNNLALALTVITENIEAVAEIFQAYVHYQMKFNKALQQHTHVTPFFGIPALPSEAAIIGGIQCDVETLLNTELSVMKHITNIKGVVTNFLLDSGPAYINSRLNKTN